jgi:hypothetical protein
MTFYQLLPFIMITLLIIFIVSSIILRKKNLHVTLFFEGLKYENNGYFEEAVVNYENALDEVKKKKFHSDLEGTIIQKLKVLHTIIEYQNGLSYTRSIDLDSVTELEKVAVSAP